MVDIRDKPFLAHEDIMGLNFIRAPGVFVFRRHYRAGLRSHIMEILAPGQLETEKAGRIVNGLRTFPRSRPRKVLRIFRKRFHDIAEALGEPKRVKMIERHLGPEYMAGSSEFIVDYALSGERQVLLCGVQEYVEGEILDPWSPLDDDHIGSLLARLGRLKPGDPTKGLGAWIRQVRQGAREFAGRVRAMIRLAGHVPDLAGIGNLILTPSCRIKLVDINNVSRVSFTSSIAVDDRGYPVCDKSIQALSLLERNLAGILREKEDPLSRVFLDPPRMRDVRAIERAFHGAHENVGYPVFTYPAPKGP
ncbi:MAG: hypothetical protein JW821_05470 [Deltaproteobacteria bacterium]|nr:hypothetical protein [Deltaproteobacteria bacterium]